jgi:hypothetical protein
VRPRVSRVVRPRSHDIATAGLGAGFMEAVFAVTPSETIKYVPCRRSSPREPAADAHARLAGRS